MILACLAHAACGGRPSSTPIAIGSGTVELLACRARIDSPLQFAEIALRSSQNLGTDRIADRTGMERNVRLHPDGTTVVFARERTSGDDSSRELFVSSIDGSRGETRLTDNMVFDDEPCWSADGNSVLFASERGGVRSLWLADATTGASLPFLTTLPGTTDGEPDWCRATDRIVWSRRSPNGRHTLWLVQGNGTGLVQLTDGGAALGDGTGDHAPAFAADGGRIAFIRRTSPVQASLCLVDLATQQVMVRWQPDGDASTPRWSPTMDRIFFGIAEPAQGRATMRLAAIAVANGEPNLVWPDERWRLEGLDVAAVMAAAPAASAPVQLDVTDANLQVAAGSAVFGVLRQLAHADGDEFLVATATIEGREVAGINCRFDLPLNTAEDTLELRIRALARSERGGADCFLRMSIYNPVDERFDTVVEKAAAGTAPQSLEFRTSSLRHLTKEKHFRVTVIGDLAPGARSNLLIDLLQVELVARSNG